MAALARLGADVPFFASGMPAARVRGVGERVEPVPAPDRHIVLVHPPFGLPTGAVFAELRRDEWGRDDNDLLSPALRLRPELGELLGAVREAGGQPRLTGSGPTVFSLSTDAEAARALAAATERRLDGTGARVSVTRTRTQPPPIEAIEEA
jgi:4-diphosphocytidyl-2-C-methyl-D-erythritol kinase